MDQNELDATTEVATSGGVMVLADLLGANVQEVAPFYGFETFPEGLFDWSLVDAGIKTLDTKNGKMAVISFSWSCTNVQAVKDQSIDPNEVIGREYEENIFVHDPMRSIGQARALIEASGGTWGPSIPQNLDAFKTAQPGITAGIKHTKDKNDPDKVYANFDMRSVKPVVKAPVVNLGG